MRNDIAVELQQVSKKFCKKLEKQMWYGFKDIVKGFFRKTTRERLRHDEFWAVKDVSLTIKKGESVGLVGVNGSGKSTLLKMINGIFMPDVGEIRICGTVGALIEAGAGFHPYLTGKENIYLNGAILGMTKKQIDRKFDEIVEFSEVEEFLNMPVKNYSSGMYVRLGFSIAAHLGTDILLIDEILAVGDTKFQQKCLAKIKELQHKGTTIIFVSHDREKLLKVCTRAVLLEKGMVKLMGETPKVLTYYFDKQNGV